jgi:hypothetical protein
MSVRVLALPRAPPRRGGVRGYCTCRSNTVGRGYCRYSSTRLVPRTHAFQTHVRARARAFLIDRATASGSASGSGTTDDHDKCT